MSQKGRLYRSNYRYHKDYEKGAKGQEADCIKGCNKQLQACIDKSRSTLSSLLEKCSYTQEEEILGCVVPIFEDVQKLESHCLEKYDLSQPITNRTSCRQAAQKKYDFEYDKVRAGLRK
ncbi:unnamed protein product [Mortierella alpina]